MSIPSVSGVNYGYYDAYTDFPQRKIQASFKGRQPELAAPQKNVKQKTGFGEGTGAFCKGLVKPLVNIVKHPIATIASAAAVTALIVGTKGKANKALITLGLGIGGWQAGKGAVNAITADTREETLKALEDMGEGTFTIAASAVGAKNYAAGLKSATTAGEAAAATSSTAATAGEAVASTTAAAGEAAANPSLLARAGAGIKAAGTYIKDSKVGTYFKDMGSGIVQTVKGAPESYRTSMAMIKSGEAFGNLKSAAGSLKLAIQQRNVEKLGEIDSYKYADKKAAYDKSMFAHNGNNKDRVSNIVINYFKAYNKLCDKGLQNSPQAKSIEKAMYNLLEKGLVSPESLAAIRSGLNPTTHIPETVATGITAGYFNGDGYEYPPEYISEAQQFPYTYQYYPAYNYGS